MIKESIDRECPLQAITIEESILADRLCSTLNAGIVRDDDKFQGTLGGALREWKRQEVKQNAVEPKFDRPMQEKYEQISLWWKMRNNLLHGLAKISGENGNFEDFKERAMLAAIDGLELVRFVDSWTRKQIQASRKGPILPFGMEMSCRIIEESFDVIKRSPNGMKRLQIVNDILRLSWAEKLKRSRKLLLQLYTRTGWCLNILRTTGFIMLQKGRWFVTDYGRDYTPNGIYGVEVIETNHNIETAV